MTKRNEQESILVVDDSPAAIEAIRRILESHGYMVFASPGVAEALAFLARASVDLVITDLKMPKASGLDLVRYVCENLQDTEIMMITGYPSINGAVAAVKIGAEEYLAKPFTDGELIAAVERGMDKLRVRRLGKTPVATPVLRRMD